MLREFSSRRALQRTARFILEYLDRTKSEDSNVLAQYLHNLKCISTVASKFLYDRCTKQMFSHETTCFS